MSVLDRLKRGVWKNDTVVYHLVSHTHWDREWYQPFEKFRRSLVQITDDVWDLLKTDSSFYHWHTDGAMSVIEDYLAIRPNEREKVEEAATKGLISLGPWYTQPDEFLVSGEALVHNLMLGMRLARRYGRPLLVGYLPDSFGHVSQLPQIYRGMGIHTALIGRGVMERNGEPNPSEAWWRSPDGSRVFVIYTASWYCNGMFNTKIGVDHVTNNDKTIRDWFLETKRIKVYERHSRTHHVLLLDGCDHSGVDYGSSSRVSSPLVTIHDIYTLSYVSRCR